MYDLKKKKKKPYIYICMSLRNYWGVFRTKKKKQEFGFNFKSDICRVPVSTLAENYNMFII